MGENETCKSACGPQTLTLNDAAFVDLLIGQDYSVRWLVDGLPAAQLMITEDDEDVYLPGFALGSIQSNGRRALNNHYDIYVDYHQASDETYRVVGVIVRPDSRKNKMSGDTDVQCGDSKHPMILSEDGDTTVIFTYSVTWIASDTSFATRWDKYLHVENPRIHWFVLSISAALVVVLCLMVSTVLVRTLRKDIARYNRLDSIAMDDLNSTSLVDDVQDDSGWKLVHGDVYRPPSHTLLLSILVGNGAQLFLMSAFTLLFAVPGFLSPSSRGSLSTMMILLFILFSFASGYVSSRTYHYLQGSQWKSLFILTPLVLPGTIFGSFFLLNLFVWARASSGAVPLRTMLLLISMWFLISVPLSLGGSWMGFKRTSPKHAVKTNQIPRQIPAQAQTYLRPIPSTMMAAALPFLAIWVEVYFILSSIWQDRIYYMFGFLFLCFFLMIMTSALITVLTTYFVLCSEDYRWQWRAFYTSGSSGIYIFAYAMIWGAKEMSLASWTAVIVFVGYSAVIAALWFIVTGEFILFSFIDSYTFQVSHHLL